MVSALPTAAALPRSYQAGLEYLLQLTPRLARADDLPALQALVLAAARHLTGCDGAALLLRDDGHCHYLAEDMPQPLWQGRRFPESGCIDGWVLRQREAVAVADVFADPRIDAARYHDTFVRSLALVPLDREQPSGALGCYWAETRETTTAELALLQALADHAAAALATLRRVEAGERRYRALFNNRNIGMVHCRVLTDFRGQPVNYRVERINDAYERIIGLSPEEIEGRLVTEIFPGIQHHEADFIGTFGAVGLHGGDAHLDVFFPPTGQWLSLYAYRPLPGEFTLLFTDISAQKRTEEALRQSEEAARATFEQASVGMVQVSSDGYLLRVNRKLCEMLGYSAEELYLKPLSFIAYGPDRDIGIAALLRMSAGEIAGTTAEKRYVRKDGTVIWVRITGAAVRDTRTGALRYHVGVIEDITSRKKAEEEHEHLMEELRVTVEIANRNRAQLETFFNQAAVGMAVVGIDGRLVRVNRRFCEMTGYEEDELVHRSLQSIMHPDDLEENLQLNRDLLSGRSPSFTVEKRYIRKDGLPVWAEATGSLARNASGQPQFYVRVVVDISARKQLEQQILGAHRELETRVEQRTGELLAANEALQKARRAAEEAQQAAEAANRAKSDFLATMSHEIRTPLNGVIGMTGLLLDSHLDEHQKKHAEVIRVSGESLLRLINDFLDFSKIESGHVKLEPLVFSPEQVLQESVALVQQRAVRRGLRLDCDVSAPKWLRGDAARLRQILLNFLGNALKFTDSGSVTLQCHQLHQSGNEVWLRFEVSDSGIGIDEAILARLFQPFTQADASTTRRHEGTGLGLAICKKLTDLMGGRIGVRTRLGEGSTFWVELPFDCVDDAAWPQLPAVTEPPARLAGPRRRILLVEDNPVNQLTASAMIKKLGCRVDVVGNGKEALEALRQVPYDLVFMDCDMPVMDGLEATRHIRAADAKYGQLPIIAMTANVLRGEKEKCLEAGMNDYLPKPVRLSDLALMLGKWLVLQQS
jgi:PAS domain S-box-containing protein